MHRAGCQVVPIPPRDAPRPARIPHDLERVVRGVIANPLAQHDARSAGEQVAVLLTMAAVLAYQHEIDGLTFCDAAAAIGRYTWAELGRAP
ncbi:MAG TPA: hypothetical protein DCQ64_03650 [Candidatus Rokubacteria bacterium]|nr:hypothetical protein [Candidatus Rokubacteria bacterium]